VCFQWILHEAYAKHVRFVNLLDIDQYTDINPILGIKVRSLIDPWQLPDILSRVNARPARVSGSNFGCIVVGNRHSYCYPPFHLVYPK